MRTKNQSFFFLKLLQNCISFFFKPTRSCVFTVNIHKLGLGLCSGLFPANDNLHSRASMKTVSSTRITSSQSNHQKQASKPTMAKRKSKSGKQKQKQTKKKPSRILGPKKRSNDVVIAAYRPAKPKPAIHNPQSSHDEQRDFERQMNSLAERSRSQQQKLAATTKIRNNRHKRGTTTKTPLLAIAMKPASFGLTKSTNQLMEETRLQMGQNKITTNGHQMGQNEFTTQGGLPGKASSLAAALASDKMTTPIASNVHKMVVVHKTVNVNGLKIDDDDERWSRGDNRYSGTNQNSFRALGGGDSDDDNEQSQLPLTTATTQSSPLMSFAPASFSVGRLLPTKTPPVTPTTNPHYRYHPQQQQREHHRHRTAAATLFGKINEEEIEERHYQQQTTDHHDEHSDLDL